MDIDSFSGGEAESTRLADLLLAANFDPALVIDRDHRLVAFNEPFATQYQQVLGSAPTRGASAADSLARLLGGWPRASELCARVFGGERFDVPVGDAGETGLARFAPLTAAGGALLAVISQRRQAAAGAVASSAAGPPSLPDVDRLRLAVAIAHVGFWEWEPASGAVYFSAEWKRQLGYADDEIANQLEEWESRLHADERHGVLEHLSRYVAQPDGDYRSEHRLRHRDGSYRWVLCQAIAETGADGRVARLRGTHLDVTELKLAEQRTREAAQHDKLTGLPNRALVFEYASHLLAAARRNRSGGAFLFIDLDRFKPINDLYGHAVGDRLLKETADRLRKCVRHEDLIGRIGGDEFVIVLPHPGKGHRAATVAQHVLESISRPFEIDSLSLSVSPSIGISHYPQHGEEADALIRAADIAMYRAKHAGRANYQTYTPGLEHRPGDCSAIEARLKGALRDNTLALHYQPVIDMHSGELVGAEALLRLNADDGSAIGPERLIPVAESSGLIAAVGEWVVAEACRQQQEWRAAGLPAITVSINVSPLQFRQRNFAARLRQIVAQSGIDPHSLQIEVKESTVMDGVDDAIRVLGDIKRQGIKVALDDFGTGYSSLTHLGKLPLDKLKVDQSFVRSAHSPRTGRAITDAILALGRTLDLEVVGEGVESEESLEYLQARDCDQAQGYFISKPLAAAEFSRWQRQHAVR